MGGSNKRNNIVILTAKEHLVAHKLLYHFNKGRYREKLAAAWMFMHYSFNSQRLLNSSDAAKAREAYSKSRKGKPAHNKGKKQPMTQEQIIAKTLSNRENNTGKKMYFNEEGRCCRRFPDDPEILELNLFTRVNLKPKGPGKGAPKGSILVKSTVTGERTRMYKTDHRFLSGGFVGISKGVRQSEAHIEASKEGVQRYLKERAVTQKEEYRDGE